MITEEKQKQIENIEAELRKLHSELQFSNSCGDWKIIKSYEYYLSGKDMPYNINELAEIRQNMRNRINTLEEQLDQLNS